MARSQSTDGGTQGPMNQIKPQLHAKTLSRKLFPNTRVKYLCKRLPQIHAHHCFASLCERDREFECKKKQTATETPAVAHPLIRRLSGPACVLLPASPHILEDVRSPLSPANALETRPIFRRLKIKKFNSFGVDTSRPGGISRSAQNLCQMQQSDFTNRNHHASY